MDVQPETQLHIGPIKLSPGVTPREVFTFLAVVALMGVMVSFSSLMQPYILAEFLHVPRASQGRIAGSLASIQQLMVLLCIWWVGALADRFGRKAMLLFAISGFTLTIFLYPLVSSVAALFVLRAMFGLSQNGHTAGGPTKMFDYPDNASRGKFMALTMVSLASVNLIVTVFGGQVPHWLQEAGLSPAEAGRDALWMLGGLGVFTGLLCAFGLQNDRKPKAAAPAGELRQGGVRTFLAGFGEVYRYALINPGFALLLITGFIIRTDTTVLQSFLAQWVVTSGSAQGLATADATRIAGYLTGTTIAAGFVVPPLFGWLLDRVNRQTVYAGSMAFAGLALMATAFVTRVDSWLIFLVIGIVGLAESSQTISQQALFGQEAPAHLRGTAYGVFAFTGTFSVVIIAFISGRLFDAYGGAAPFVLAGALHLVFLAIALVFMRRQKLLRKARDAA